MSRIHHPYSILGCTEVRMNFQPQKSVDDVDLTSTVTYSVKQNQPIQTHTIRYREGIVLVIPIHRCFKFLDKCCTLLESEWPARSEFRRERLKRSQDPFPTSLLLILRASGVEDRVVGHCRIKLMQNAIWSCFIESVVIAKDLRGKGWGRFLMCQAESYALSRGMKYVHLETKDCSEGFYRKLNYIRSNPVSLCGMFNNDRKLFVTTGSLSDVDYNSDRDTCKSFQKDPTSSNDIQIPPPPPPPLPKCNLNNTVGVLKPKITMKKCLISDATGKRNDEYCTTSLNEKTTRINRHLEDDNNAICEIDDIVDDVITKNNVLNEQLLPRKRFYLNDISGRGIVDTGVINNSNITSNSKTVNKKIISKRTTLFNKKLKNDDNRRNRGHRSARRIPKTTRTRKRFVINKYRAYYTCRTKRKGRLLSKRPNTILNEIIRFVEDDPDLIEI